MSDVRRPRYGVRRSELAKSTVFGFSFLTVAESSKQATSGASEVLLKLLDSVICYREINDPPTFFYRFSQPVSPTPRCDVIIT